MTCTRFICPRCGIVFCFMLHFGRGPIVLYSFPHEFLGLGVGGNFFFAFFHVVWPDKILRPFSITFLVEVLGFLPSDVRPSSTRSYCCRIRATGRMVSITQLACEADFLTNIIYSVEVIRSVWLVIRSTDQFGGTRSLGQPFRSNSFVRRTDSVEELAHSDSKYGRTQLIISTHRILVQLGRSHTHSKQSVGM